MGGSLQADCAVGDKPFRGDVLAGQRGVHPRADIDSCPKVKPAVQDTHIARTIPADCGSSTRGSSRFGGRPAKE